MPSRTLSRALGRRKAFQGGDDLALFVGLLFWAGVVTAAVLLLLR